jgi:hypothetical protein
MEQDESRELDGIQSLQPDLTEPKPVPLGRSLFPAESAMTLARRLVDASSQATRCAGLPDRLADAGS